MKIFVTGATGFIGTKLVRVLADRGNVIHALYRDESGTAKLGYKNIRPFKGSLGDPGSLERAVDGCEQVYHVAAYARPWAGDPGVYHEVNTEGCRRVLDVASRAGVGKLLFVSTAGVYGPSENKSVREKS